MIPFQLTDWSTIEAIEQNGTTGSSFAKAKDYGSFKVRMVEYSANYEADHWCEKGHIAYCVKGELELHLSDGTSNILKEGASFQVSDNISSHKVRSKKSAKLFIIDGEFLK